MLVSTSTIPVSSSNSTRATSSPFAVMVMLPLVTGLPVTRSVTFTRTVTLPAVLLTISASVVLLRCVTRIFSSMSAAL